MNIIIIIAIACIFSLTAVITGLTLGMILMIRSRYRKFGKPNIGRWFRE